MASTRPGMRGANPRELERITKELEVARQERSILANDIALLERALLEIERAAGSRQAVLAIVHRVLGEPEERAG